MARRHFASRFSEIYKDIAIEIATSGRAKFAEAGCNQKWAISDFDAPGT
jgi:hypothetical protein